MATYSFYKIQATPSANPVTGKSVLMRADLDFAKQNVLSTDVMRAIRLKDHWVIKNAWYRVHTAHAAGTKTVDIGTADNGTEIASNIDMTTAGDWVQGKIGKDSAGTTGAHAVTGKLQVMIEVVAMPGAED
jgi:hypothetical protein